MIKNKSFPLTSGMKQECLFSSLLFNTVLAVLARAIRQEKALKYIKIVKEEVKISLFADDINLHAGNLKDSTKQFSELIH